MDLDLGAGFPIVAIAWVDFRSFSWVIRASVSRDDGASFGEVFRVDDATDVPWETIHSEPQVVFTGDGALLAVWTDLRVRREDYDIRARRFDLAAPGAASASVALASTDLAGRPQWRPALAASGDRVLVAWQDFRRGRNELRWTQSVDAGGTFAADASLHGDVAGEAFNPAVAVLRDRMVVVYESTSSGERRIAMATP